MRRAVTAGGEEIIRELLRAGLRDRDYENLLTGNRLAAHAASSGEGKRVVCNCLDEEPGLEIVRFLLESEPGAIVAGALIAALASGSQANVFHVAEDDRKGHEAVLAAAGSLRVGTTPLEHADVQVLDMPFRRNRKGYEEVPTLLLTAETLLNVSRVLAMGADAYRLIGSEESPGTKFFQISGAVNRPGVAELPLGTSLREVIGQAGGGLAPGETLKAVLVGGAHGACYTPNELDLLLDFDNVKCSGGAIGSGAIAVLTKKDCVVDAVKQRIMTSCYATCGTCSVGREGSYQLGAMLADATRGKGRASDLDLLREIGLGMRVAAACPSGKTAPNLVLSSLVTFPEEYEAHVKRKQCAALVCNSYVTFHILPDLCDGCGDCAGVCPEDAIEGGRKKIHVIRQDSCEKSGRCYQVCSELRHAVVKAGAVKPRTPREPVPAGSWKGWRRTEA